MESVLFTLGKGRKNSFDEEEEFEPNKDKLEQILEKHHHDIDDK